MRNFYLKFNLKMLFFEL